jgi:AraC-like DNA-binding protein
MLPGTALRSRHDRVGTLGATSASERDALTAPEPVVAYESDSLVRAFPEGLESEFVRCGPGDEPARVEQVAICDLTLSLVEFGFPVQSRVESSGGVVAAGRVRRAPAGARWSGVSLAEQQIHAMGPKTDHLGVYPAGFVTSIVTIGGDLLRETADLLGHSVDVDNLVGPLPWSSDLIDAFDGIEAVLARSAGQTIVDVCRLQDDLVGAITRAAHRDDDKRTRSRSLATSQWIVGQCLDYVGQTAMSQPSIADLCRASAVSERRVRSAFLDVTDMAPNRYFRLRALTDARTLLGRAQRDSTSVTDVAYELGIYHLSHFARDYRALFDESPSDTLQA